MSVKENKKGKNTFIFGMVCLALVLVMCADSASASSLVLARNGRAQCVIEVSRSPLPSEETAALELQEYLGRIIGDRPEIVVEGRRARGNRIIIGHTELTRAEGILPGELGPEEWIIKTSGSSLILTGGRPRGVLYAVYRFLEDELGVRWWNPWEETVPLNPNLVITGLNMRGEPAFDYRDVFVLSLRDRPELYGREREKFAVRNRLNRYGHTRIRMDYGGSRDYGPPHHVHTFFRYIPPNRYFKTNPEFFSKIDGERTTRNAQLCLTNRELRQVFLGKLKEFIEQGEKRAKEMNLAPPEVYSISPNDGTGACQCDECRAFVEREGSEVALLLDFVNEMADAVRETHPHIYIDTLAYWYTVDRPRSIRAAENVIVRLCDTESNYAVPLTEQDEDLFMRGWANEHFPGLVQGWAEITDNLRIWEYGITYRFHRPEYIASGSGLPFPSVHTYAPNHRFYLENNVEGVFVEKERPILADVRDFKEWIKIKLLEDPHRDEMALMREFADGFYGDAGTYFLEYRKLLREARDRSRVHIGFYGYPPDFFYVDVKTALAAHDLFDRGEKKISGDPVLERRWRHARLSLDRVTYTFFRKYLSNWEASGRRGDEFPLNLDNVISRFRRTFAEQAELRVIPETRAGQIARMEKELEMYAKLGKTGLPQKFRDLPGDLVYDLTADYSHYHRGLVKMVEDPEAESGFASRLEFTDATGLDVDRYKLPMEWGLYSRRAKTIRRGSIREGDVPGPGYHWYKMGSYTIDPSCYIYLLGWILQKDIGGIFDPYAPDAEYEIWGRVKLEGPAFPHGKEDDDDAISIERVILLRQ